MKLIVESGPSKGGRFNLSGVVLVGRSPTNNLVINDHSLSLLHARIQVAPGNTFITDLGSTNGTWVNGKRIVSCKLCDGDVLQIGDSRISVQIAATFTEPVPTFVKSGPIDVDPIGPLTDNIFGSVTYSLNRKIADGGMGSIYEAQQFGAQGFIKKVAIKTIRPEFASRESLVAAIVGEALLVANLVHQNIVQIHHFGRHQGGYYIAMEFIDGITLTEFMRLHVLQERTVPVDLATFIISRIAHGLEYAHSKKSSSGTPLNLVHRDVSPSNIMIDKEGEVKLTDFGVAQAAQFMEDEPDDLVGCVEFMSPEQASCLRVDGRSDIFSLGLVFYELLTGTRLFRCENGDLARTVEAILLTSVPDPRKYRSDIPEEIVYIIMRMLQKSTEERYPTAGALSLALEEDMYSAGYGPTVLKLASYVATLTLEDDQRQKKSECA